MDLHGHKTNGNHYISTRTVSMFIKLGRTLPYHGGFLRLKSHDPLITTMPMATKLGRVVTDPLIMVTCPESHKTVLSRGLAGSRDKLKLLKSPLPQCPWSPNMEGW